MHQSESLLTQPATTTARPRIKPQSQLTGVIAVTGADGHVGRVLLDALRASAAQTVAITRRPADVPADRRIAASLDSPAAFMAINSADFVVHLAGTLRPSRMNSCMQANLLTAQSVCRALRGSRAKRVVFLSFVGASEGSRNQHLRTKAAAERMLEDTGIPVVVLRCSHILGPPEAPGPFAQAMIARGRRTVVVPGNGRQRVRPVFVGDVAEAIVAALQRGSRGMYELVGPETMTLDDLARLVNRNMHACIRHVPAWMDRLVGLACPVWPSVPTDLMLRDAVGDPTLALETLGVRLTSLRDVWR